MFLSNHAPKLQTDEADKILEAPMKTSNEEWANLTILDEEKHRKNILQYRAVAAGVRAYSWVIALVDPEASHMTETIIVLFNFVKRKKQEILNSRNTQSHVQ